MSTHDLSILIIWLPIILSWVGLVFTIRYIKLTGEMVREMRSARDPSVYVDVENDKGKYKILVGNCGDSPAFNVKFSFSEPSPFRSVNGITPADKTLAQHPITFIAPKSRLKFWAGYFDHSSSLPVPDLVAVIQYDNEEGKHFSRACRINTMSLENLLFETFRDPASEIAEAIKASNLSSDLKHLSKDFSSKMRSSKQEDTRPRVPCPVCAEFILLDAKKCRFCQESIQHMIASSTGHTDQS